MKRVEIPISSARRRWGRLTKAPEASNFQGHFQETGNSKNPQGGQISKKNSGILRLSQPAALLCSKGTVPPGSSEGTHSALLLQCADMPPSDSDGNFGAAPGLAGDVSLSSPDATSWDALLRAPDASPRARMTLIYAITKEDRGIQTGRSL